ncbi:MAG: Fe-S cluster assembly protein SufD [Candidatus Kapabacteria bacterium]|nr:Fe-S cluster assembly protein SufD [Candidatus Kapabacteria bacterium]
MSQHALVELVQNLVPAHAGGDVSMGGHGRLSALRQDGLREFVRMGIPTTRHEEWKYTNVFPFIGLDYSYAPMRWDASSASAPAVVSAAEVRDALGQHISIRVLNGIVSVDAPQLPAGLEVIELTPELVESDAGVAAALSAGAPMHANPFVALNTALLESGIVIRLAKGLALELPIHVSIETTSGQQPMLVAPRILVIAHEGAEADIIQSHHASGPSIVLDATVVEFSVAAAANVRYHKIADDSESARSISSVTADVHRDASFTSHALSVGGRFVRNDLAVRLCEPSSQGFLYGVSLLAENEYTDNHTVVDHMLPHCHSEELYKGIYDGTSSGVFNGKIYVRPQAQKTTAYQSNHTLLLSPKAQVQAKPQLEIWADDVKCSHGATMGQVNDEAIFYFRSRGIDKDMAKALLTYAFITEVVEKITLDGLRELLTHRIARKLSAESLLF